MRIRDKAAFLPLNYRINLTDNEREIAAFTISLNFSVRLFYKLLTYCEALDDERTSIDDKAEYLIDLFYDIITLDPSARTISKEWILDNIPVSAMLEVISGIFTKLNEVLSGDDFSIPDIEVKKKTPQGKQSDAEKEWKKKRREIEQLQKKLSQCGTHLTDEITMMMENTSCSYTEIMNMPILIYKAILRSIYLGKMRTDDDYNLAYLNAECEKPENRKTIIENAMNSPIQIPDVKAINNFMKSTIE